MLPEKKAIIKVLDEVNCVIMGLNPKDNDYFKNLYSPFADGYFFSKKYKLGVWDGKISFYSKGGRTYVQLLDEIIPEIKKRGYKLQLIDNRECFQLKVPTIDKDYFQNAGIELGQHQIDAINSITTNNGGIVLAATGAGKAQPLDSKVLTPSGWITMGELSLGDIVNTPDNKTAEIIGIFPQGKKDIYELTFADGSIVRTCGEHLWEINLPEKYPHKMQSKRYATIKTVKTTKELKTYLDYYKTVKSASKNITINYIKPQSFMYQQEVSFIDPYVIGVILGDGGVTTENINITSKDDEIVNYIQSTLKEDYSLKYNDNYTYRLSKIHRNKKENIYKTELNRLGIMGKYSWEKSIPANYLFSSKETRISIIQGLMDTDGYIDKHGRIEYTTTSEQLAFDVVHLLKSLGMAARIRSKIPTFTYDGIKKLGRTTYTVAIQNINDNISLFRLSRKKDRVIKSSTTQISQFVNRIESITYVGEEEAQCILIDHHDHLYITDNFTITHNTMISASLARLYNEKYGFKVIQIVPNSDLVSQGVEDFQNLELDVGEYSGDKKDLNHDIIISTWQALQNNPQIMGIFQVAIVDECHGTQGKVLKDILNNHGAHLFVRIGVTGTLPESEVDRLSVKITLGTPQIVITAKHLIDSRWLAELDISILELQEDKKREYEAWKLKFPDEAEQVNYKEFLETMFPDYDSEKKYLNGNLQRLEWIARLIELNRVKDKGNSLILVNSVPTGKKLAEHIPNAHFVYGMDKKAFRKAIYALFKDNDDIVVIATAQLASTGLNIPRIFNLYLMDIGKSYIRVIQSIGRGLRKAHDKTYVNVFDISSNLRYSKDHQNKRITHYKKAEYPYTKQKITYNKD